MSVVRLIRMRAVLIVPRPDRKSPASLFEAGLPSCQGKRPPEQALLLADAELEAGDLAVCRHLAAEAQAVPLLAAAKGGAFRFQGVLRQGKASAVLLVWIVFPGSYRHTEESLIVLLQRYLVRW